MTINRRQFLRGQFSKREAPIRPPWSLSGSAFLHTCSKCNECIDACPQHIIVKGDDGFPEVGFDEGGCTFCGECAAVCKDGAIVRDEISRPLPLTLSIADVCISRQGVTCRACGDACHEEAISFQLQAGGITTPLVDQFLCTGCGFCLYPCPVGAITISKRKVRRQACL